MVLDLAELDAEAAELDLGIAADEDQLTGRQPPHEMARSCTARLSRTVANGSVTNRSAVSAS